MCSLCTNQSFVSVMTHCGHIRYNVGFNILEKRIYHMADMGIISTIFQLEGNPSACETERALDTNHTHPHALCYLNQF